ncbi:hypothetical protein Tco_1178945 [Tanacetum coccineum]
MIGGGGGSGGRGGDGDSNNVLKGSRRIKAQRAYGALRQGADQGTSFMNMKGGEECGLDSKEDEVLPKVDDVSFIDGVFDGAFGGDRDEYFVIGEGLEEEALVEAMEKEVIEEDDEENKGDDYLIKMRWINVVRHGYSDFGFQMVFRKMQKCSWG